MTTLYVYLVWDGDHVGRLVGRANMADDPGEVKRISQAIEKGNEIWKSWALAEGGDIISCGGDEGSARIAADKLAQLPDLRERYAGAVGSTVSVGVGTKLSEAGKALMAAKLRGGDRVTLYDPEIEEELAKVKDQTEAEKISEAYLNKAIAAPQYTPEQRARYKAVAAPAPQPHRKARPASLEVKPGAEPTPNQQELATNMHGMHPDNAVLVDQLVGSGAATPQLPPVWGKPVSKKPQVPAEDASGPEHWTSQYRPDSMYQTKAASDRARVASEHNRAQNDDIGGATYGPDQWGNVQEAALNDASHIPEIPDPTDPSRRLHFKWRSADPETDNPETDNFGAGRSKWSRAVDVWSRSVDSTGRPTWWNAETRGFFPLTPEGLVNHGDVSSTSTEQHPDHINQIIGHINQHTQTNDTWKSEEFAKADPGLNRGQGGGMSAPDQPEAPQEAEQGAAEQSEGMTAGSPPAPESAPAADIHAQLGQVADAQGQQDQADQEAQQSQQDGQQEQGDLKQQVLKILKVFHDRSQDLEQLQQQDPELYQSMVGMVKVLIGGARTLFGVGGDQPQGQEEQEVKKSEPLMVPLKDIRPDQNNLAQAIDNIRRGMPAQTAGPVTLYRRKGKKGYELGDGHHRFVEAQSRGESHIQATISPDILKSEDSIADTIVDNSCKHFYGKGSKCLKCKASKDDLDKASLQPGKTGHHNVVLPPGSTKDPAPQGTREAGKIKVTTAEGGEKWRSVRAGLITAQDGSPISSRNPNGK